MILRICYALQDDCKTSKDFARLCRATAVYRTRKRVESRRTDVPSLSKENPGHKGEQEHSGSDPSVGSVGNGLVDVGLVCL